MASAGCVQNSQLVGDSFKFESEQICQQRVELRRVGAVNAPVDSRELVANCVHTADATQRRDSNSTVAPRRRRRCVLGKRLPNTMSPSPHLLVFDHMTPLFRQLHWLNLLKASERIAFKKVCYSRIQIGLHGSVPSYLVDELCQMADVEARQRLRSASSSSLIVGRTRLSTVGDRAFPVASARIWNSLPQHVTSAPSLLVFRSRLKTHLFTITYPSP